jgi:dynein heavy chain
LQPKTASSKQGISREESIANTAKGILEKLPLSSLDVGSYDLVVFKQQYENRGWEMTPCRVVLFQELERWNNLVKMMASSLIDLQKALSGDMGMNDTLDALGEALANGFLPALWRKLAPDTDKPLGSWLEHFHRRYEQYDKWLQEGVEPVVMWLSGLHIPESFLTALVQTTCRERQWPLDKSTLFTRVTHHTDVDTFAESEDALLSRGGAFVTGLYLEGAGWDVEEGVLMRQKPKVLVTPLPIMQIIPIEASKLKLHNTFRTPVYVTQRRRNAMGVGMVFEADLSTQEHPSHWVLQGVALTLNTDE